MHDFSIKEILAKAWETTTHNFGVLIWSFAVLTLISIASSVIPGILGSALGKTNPLAIVLDLVITLFFSLWLGPILQAGIIQVYLNVVDSKPASVGQLFSRKELWWKYLLTSVLYGLIMMAIFLGVAMIYGIIFGALSLTGMSSQQILSPTGYEVWLLIAPVVLVIPIFVFVTLRYSFWPYLLVDKSCGVTEALKSSWSMTKGLVFKLFLFFILVWLINLAGIISLVVGALFTLPLTTIAYAHLYRRISK